MSLPTTLPEAHRYAPPSSMTDSSLLRMRLAGQETQPWVSGVGMHDVQGASDTRARAISEILERAMVNHPTLASLRTWLDTPFGPDGKTPAQLLAEGQYNRARLCAMLTPSPDVSRPPAGMFKAKPAVTGSQHVGYQFTDDDAEWFEDVD